MLPNGYAERNVRGCERRLLTTRSLRATNCLMATVRLPPAARALAAILDAESGPDAVVAEKIRARVHRTALWRYLTGRREPDLATATFLDQVSDGRIGAARWLTNTRAA